MGMVAQKFAFQFLFFFLLFIFKSIFTCLASALWLSFIFFGFPVMMLLYLLSAEELRTVLGRLGHPLSADTIRRYGLEMRSNRSKISIGTGKSRSSRPMEQFRRGETILTMPFEAAAGS